MCSSTALLWTDDRKGEGAMFPLLPTPGVHPILPTPGVCPTPGGYSISRFVQEEVSQPWRVCLHLSKLSPITSLSKQTVWMRPITEVCLSKLAGWGQSLERVCLGLSKLSGRGPGKLSGWGQSQERVYLVYPDEASHWISYLGLSKLSGWGQLLKRVLIQTAWMRSVNGDLSNCLGAVSIALGQL